jgi:hypothetical protein
VVDRRQRPPGYVTVTFDCGTKIVECGLAEGVYPSLRALGLRRRQILIVPQERVCMGGLPRRWYPPSSVGLDAEGKPDAFHPIRCSRWDGMKMLD